MSSAPQYPSFARYSWGRSMSVMGMSGQPSGRPVSAIKSCWFAEYPPQPKYRFRERVPIKRFRPMAILSVFLDMGGIQICECNVADQCDGSRSGEEEDLCEEERVCTVPSFLVILLTFGNLL